MKKKNSGHLKGFRLCFDIARKTKTMLLLFEWFYTQFTIFMHLIPIFPCSQQAGS
jgi:hypothetical protein